VINREITYKRDINCSYMIVPAMPENNFDEKILLRRCLDNFIPVQKCYEGSAGQYWYDITGKQALDSYCRINNIGKIFFETLILKLCQAVEVLDWNLVDVNCLVLDPELIFINTQEELSFVAYPFHKGNLALELQQLLEYMLTKLDHKDTTVVGWAYKIYEMSLLDGMSITDLKQVILEERSRMIVPSERKIVREEAREEDGFEKQAVQHNNFSPESIKQKIQDVLKELLASLENKFPKKINEYIPIVVYPEDPEEQQEEDAITLHPTVCLSTMKKDRRELICDRKGVFPDFVLEKGAYIVGKNHKVQFHIEKDTISQFHARIECQGNIYYIEDLNSTNGTYVNENLLSYKSRKELQSGDSIRFGDVGYHFY